MNPDFKSLYKSACVCMCVCVGGGWGDTRQRHSSGTHYSRDGTDSHVSVWHVKTIHWCEYHDTRSVREALQTLVFRYCIGFRMTHIFIQNGKPCCFTSHKIFHKMSILRYFCDLIIIHIWTKQLSVVYCKWKKFKKNNIHRLNWPDQETNLNWHHPHIKKTAKLWWKAAKQKLNVRVQVQTAGLLNISSSGMWDFCHWWVVSKDHSFFTVTARIPWR